MSVETAIKNATASLEMEGMSVSDELKELCIKKINKEITMDEYIKLAMALKGVRM